jgi:hypothetical protein
MEKEPRTLTGVEKHHLSAPPAPSENNPPL